MLPWIQIQTALQTSLASKAWSSSSRTPWTEVTAASQDWEAAHDSASVAGELALMSDSTASRSFGDLTWGFGHQLMHMIQSKFLLAIHAYIIYIPDHTWYSICPVNLKYYWCARFRLSTVLQTMKFWKLKTWGCGRSAAFSKWVCFSWIFLLAFAITSKQGMNEDWELKRVRFCKSKQKLSSWLKVYYNNACIQDTCIYYIYYKIVCLSISRGEELNAYGRHWWLQCQRSSSTYFVTCQDGEWDQITSGPSLLSSLPLAGPLWIWLSQPPQILRLHPLP